MVINAVAAYETVPAPCLMTAMDNITVAAYVSLLEEKHSASLLFELVHTILLRSEQDIPNVTNVLADILSRPSTPKAIEWMLHQEPFSGFAEIYGCQT